MTAKPLKVYFDGGCCPNPGRIEVAVVARGQVYYFDDLGEGSSSDAEWLALCCAVELAQSLGVPQFDLIGDSRTIVDQSVGAVRCRSASERAYLTRFQAAVAAQPPRRIRWVPRHQNLAGIALARRRALPFPAREP